MSRFEAETTIDRPAGTVWSYAADILRHPDWMAVADGHVLRGTGTELGARGRERLIMGPFRWDVEFEVAQAEPGRRLLWRAIDDRHFDDFEVGLELAPIGSAATHATYHGSVRMRGRWRLLSFLVSMEGSAGVRRELGALKMNVETAPAVAAAI